MPTILNHHEENQFRKPLDRETYEWTKQQRSQDNKETFVYITIATAAVAVYATWTWMIIQKLRA
jgi:hypothetical protein